MLSDAATVHTITVVDLRC